MLSSIISTISKVTKYSAVATIVFGLTTLWDSYSSGKKHQQMHNQSMVVQLQAIAMQQRGQDILIAILEEMRAERTENRQRDERRMIEAQQSSWREFFKKL